MRPVRRGPSPQANDFNPYGHARPYLIGRLGSYCSFCERPLPSGPHVEHIQPKQGDHGRPDRVGSWSNFLLACVNCNSTKGDQEVILANVLLPDRDNTFAAFVYSPDGAIQPVTGLPIAVNDMAVATLRLTGLDKRPSLTLDEKGEMLAIERMSQRMEAWAQAEDAKNDVDANPGNDAIRRRVVKHAQALGFFSVWMTVFADDADMRDRFIDAFRGTRDSGCFYAGTTLPVSPAPNPDNLESGGKV